MVERIIGEIVTIINSIDIAEEVHGCEGLTNASLIGEYYSLFHNTLTNIVSGLTPSKP